jgi:hypothetical protein
MNKILRYLSFKDYMGHYEVNGIEFLNKFDAFAACGPGQWPSWHWFDEEFSRQDWTKEPELDLYEIYRRRAEQIRAKYDYLIVCWSGGVDSLGALRAFIDNDIKVDAVVSFGAWTVNNPENYLNNAEILKVAVPYMDRLAQTKNVKVPYWLIDDAPHYHELTNQNFSWLERSNGRCFTIRIMPMHLGLLKDPRIQELRMKGTVGIVYGVEKPKLIYENNTWKFTFMDLHAGIAMPPPQDQKNIHLDYFFWAPDMPELLCKQAHVIKNYFESTGLINNTDIMNKCFSRERTLYNRTTAISYIDPLVYGRWISDKPGQPRSYFSLGKVEGRTGGTGGLQDKEDVFWNVIATPAMRAEYFGQLASMMNRFDRRFINGEPQELTPYVFAKSGIIGSFTKDYIISQ